MTENRTFLVATVGQGVMRSHDQGETWRRIAVNQDLEFDATVRCLLADPGLEHAVFAGAESGLFRSEDCGVSWHRIDCALNEHAVWKIAVAPSKPTVMYAGTGSPSRATFFRSEDAGRHWEHMPLVMPPKCAGVSRPRMLALAVDPGDPSEVWVGVEEGGLFRSRDAGESWTRIDDAANPSGVHNSDVHSIVILTGPPKTLLVMVVNALHRSHDGGARWEETSIRANWGIYYSRVMLRIPGTDQVLMGIGDGTPGTTSMLLRSANLGETWSSVALPVPPNSCFWALGAHPADSRLLLAGTKYGYLFRSTNCGASWAKEWREFSEISDLAWLPARPQFEQEASHG